MPPPSNDMQAVESRKCLHCKKHAIKSFFPFCSARCKNIDLGRWLLGKYTIETDEPADENSLNNDSDLE